MANIKDVAKCAGVGLGTVSRFLNGYNVTEANRIKIEQAIRELDFKVNQIARSMKTKKSMTVAIVVPRLANIFSMKIIESIENYLEAYGYSIIVCDCSENGKKELERLKFTVEKMVDGIVLMSSNTNAAEIKEVIGDIPIVLVDRVFEENIFDNVTVENRTSTYIALNACIKKGNKKVALLAGPKNISTAKQRLSGALEVLKDRNIDIEKEMICECRYEINDGYHAVKELLSKKPDVIFASNYELTIGAIKALNEAKFIIGKDIHLIGFDNLELVNVYPYSMMVITQPMEEIGKQAAKCLLARMEDMNTSIKNVVLKNEIINT